MSENPENNISDLLSGGGLSSLLQNPEVAAKLPRIMEALAPVMAEMKAGKTEPVTETAAVADSADLETGLIALTKGSGSHKGDGGKRRAALLKALTPYLSDNRKEALDYVVKVTSLIDLLSEVM